MSPLLSPPEKHPLCVSYLAGTDAEVSQDSWLTHWVWGRTAYDLPEHMAYTGPAEGLLPRGAEGERALPLTPSRSTGGTQTVGEQTSGRSIRLA